jgi:hypothetical protein
MTKTHTHTFMQTIHDKHFYKNFFTIHLNIQSFFWTVDRLLSLKSTNIFLKTHIPC